MYCDDNNGASHWSVKMMLASDWLMLTWVSGSMLSGMVICCFSWHSTHRFPETEKCLRLRFTSFFYYYLCSCPERQEVNYCRLNEFVNNAFRPTPELYCKRNFLKIIARLTQLMIQIVANWDKSCQFFFRLARNIMINCAKKAQWHNTQQQRIDKLKSLVFSVSFCSSGNF